MDRRRRRDARRRARAPRPTRRCSCRTCRKRRACGTPSSPTASATIARCRWRACSRTSIAGRVARPGAAPAAAHRRRCACSRSRIAAMLVCVVAEGIGPAIGEADADAGSTRFEPLTRLVERRARPAVALGQLIDRALHRRDSAGAAGRRGSRNVRRTVPRSGRGRSGGLVGRGRADPRRLLARRHRGAGNHDPARRHGRHRSRDAVVRDARPHSQLASTRGCPVFARRSTTSSASCTRRTCCRPSSPTRSRRAGG